jgi:hypothetical protein
VHVWIGSAQDDDTCPDNDERKERTDADQLTKQADRHQSGQDRRRSNR